MEMDDEIELEDGEAWKEISGYTQMWGKAQKISELPSEKLELLEELAKAHSELPWKHVVGNEQANALASYYLEHWTRLDAEVMFSLIGQRSHLSAFVFEDLPWDSGLLQKKCVRIYPLSSPEVLPENWRDQDILALARPLADLLSVRDVQLADIKVSTADLYLMHSLEFSGFHTVDVLLTLGAKAKKLRDIVSRASESFRVLNSESVSFTNGVTVRPIRTDEVSSMEALAREAFSDTDAIKDRFYLEPSIDHERSNDLFLEWFRNSVRKQENGNGVVLIAEKKGTALGFLTLDAPSHPALAGFWQDGLNAVSESARGEGVYRSLVIAAMHYTLEHEGQGLITRTQVSTNRVINTWMHLGAELFESFCTLHWTSED